MKNNIKLTRSRFRITLITHFITLCRVPTFSKMPSYQSSATPKENASKTTNKTYRIQIQTELNLVNRIYKLNKIYNSYINTTTNNNNGQNGSYLTWLGYLK